jgi:hypothetical protein
LATLLPDHHLLSVAKRRKAALLSNEDMKHDYSDILMFRDAGTLAEVTGSRVEQRRVAGNWQLSNVLLVGFGTFLLIALGYQVLGFSVNRSDAAEYIRWSHHLLSFDAFASHLPGFPALIALARILTFGLLGDAVVAQLVCLAFWGLGVWLSFKLAEVLAPEVADVAALLFGCFPLVGITYAAFPIADIPAAAIFIGACVAALRGRGWLFAGITGLGLLIHQALYPFYLFLGIWSLMNRRISLTQFLLSGVPFVAYYVAGAVSHSDPAWVLHYHTATTLKAVSALPVFDGVIGTFLRGSGKDLMKGFLMLAVLMGSGLLTCYFAKRKNWLMLVFLVPLVVYGIISNERAGWILMRLARLLALPVCVWLGANPTFLAVLQKRWVCFMFVGLLVISQFLWAGYMFRFYSLK